MTTKHYRMHPANLPHLAGMAHAIVRAPLGEVMRYQGHTLNSLPLMLDLSMPKTTRVKNDDGTEEDQPAIFLVELVDWFAIQQCGATNA